MTLHMYVPSHHTGVESTASQTHQPSRDRCAAQYEYRTVGSPAQVY